MDVGVKKDQFVDEITGKPLNLAGSHTWNNVQPINGRVAPLSTVVGNFTRLWTIETKRADFSNSIWGSNTPGIQRIEEGPYKKDGSLNKAYYRNLKTTVRRADKRDIVTGVCLFEYTITAYFPGGWSGHPFNGLGPSDPSEIHTKGPWNIYQRAHVKRVTEILEPYDNVIYEVGNELPRNSTGWFQSQVIKWVKKFTDKPVGASYAAAVYQNQDWLKRVGADFIVPGNGNRAGGVHKLSGFKGPQILDTDHAWPLHSNVEGLRTAWSQGRPLWLMEGLDGNVLRNQDSLQPDRDYINSIT